MIAADLTAIAPLRLRAIRGIMDDGRVRPRLVARKPMPVSMLDQTHFPLACNHMEVLGRLEGKKEWICEDCGKRTDLEVEPFKAQLAKELDAVHKIDLQAKAKGGMITRL
ncbi:MAG: hypothetical protein KGK01_04285 [Bradyrhizobium sp.]|nr:hypothetical protein [Bradyrhizobium sp.]